MLTQTNQKQLSTVLCDRCLWLFGHGASSDARLRALSTVISGLPSYHAQMSAWQGSAVPCRLLHTGHRCCWQAAFQVGHTANDGGATVSAILCWPPSIRCARPHGLELLAG